MYKVEFHPPGSHLPAQRLARVRDQLSQRTTGGPGYGKDSLIFFDAPADGAYQARCERCAQGGRPDQCVFASRLRPPKPDYTVNFTPTAPAVWKAGAIPVTVNATRLDGFDGLIRVKLEGLPQGFSAPAGVIDANQLSTTPRALRRCLGHGSRQCFLQAFGHCDDQWEGSVARSCRRRTETPGTRRRGDHHPTGFGEHQAGSRNEIDRGRRTARRLQGPRAGGGARLAAGVRVLNIGLNGILITERDTSREIVIYAEPWVQPMNARSWCLAKSERKGTEHAAKSVMLKVEK